MIELTVRVARAHAEPVLAELLALVPAGLEERDAGEAVEYVLYGPPGELPALGALEAAAGPALVRVRTREIADDWSERWKHFHRPVEVGGGDRPRVRVRPPWEPAAPDGAADLELVIDPGQAFGTGGHHTTRLCLELLLERPPGGPLADWGCGTGVLAIAAARLGWAPVRAVDFDALAVQATKANAAANGAPVDVARRDLRGEPGPHAPVVVANLLRPLLLDVAAGLREAPDVLIVSGVLREEAAEVAGAFARRGLRETARRVGGEWAALSLER